MSLVNLEPYAVMRTIFEIVLPHITFPFCLCPEICGDDPMGDKYESNNYKTNHSRSAKQKINNHHQYKTSYKKHTDTSRVLQGILINGTQIDRRVFYGQ